MLITPTQTMLAVGKELTKLSFRRVFTSRSGSRYYKFGTIPFHLRVSDHNWSYLSSQKQVQVVHNLVTNAVNSDDVKLLAFDAAIAFVAAVRERTGQIRAIA